MKINPEDIKEEIAVWNVIIRSRLAELFFATGISLIGFMLATKNIDTLYNFIWFYPVTLLAGWHVLAVNDFFFSDKHFPRREELLSPAFFLPVFLVPVAGTLVLLEIGNWSFATSIALTVVNWDIYSIFGKRRWISGLLHNSLAGALHFSIGLTAAGCLFFHEFRPETIFFALAMTGAAIHHDASHTLEDFMHDYKTGAVVFGHSCWWRCAIIPMSFSLLPLCYCNNLFSMVFVFSLIIYLISYIIFNLSFSGEDFTRRYSIFRTLCRVIFALGGLIFIVLSMTRLFSSV